MPKRTADDEWENKTRDLYVVKKQPLGEVMKAMELEGFVKTYVPLASPI
jgi:hypothetical protein